MEKWVVAAIIAVVVILVLMVIPSKIQEVSKFFKSFGEPESEDLLALKEDCNNKIDNNKDIGNCALEVARKTLEAKGGPLIAEAWLKHQIELTDDEALLRDCFEFARDTLYAALKGSSIEKELYEKMYKKAQTQAFKEEINTELLRLSYTISYENIGSS